MRKQVLFSAMLMLGMTGGLTLTSVPAMASVTQQTIKVKGQVVDQDGEPLIGATVKVKGSQTGAVTDFDGNFTIDAASNATLVISYVGFKDREIAVRGRAVIDKIQMESDSQVLDQLVVVGYGTQKKADLTGSVSIVNAEELKRVSNSNISTMLEGKVRVLILQYVFVVSAHLVAQLLCMLSMVYLWVPPFATSRLTTLRPFRY